MLIFVASLRSPTVWMSKRNAVAAEAANPLQMNELLVWSGSRVAGV